jgi:hypothetical protein
VRGLAAVEDNRSLLAAVAVVRMDQTEAVLVGRPQGLVRRGFVGLVGVRWEEHSIVEDSHRGLALAAAVVELAMGGSRILGERRGHLGVWMGRRRTGDCRLGSQNGR